MDVVRGGIVSESIECPKQGIIPHDMVHYAVERSLQKRGFIGRLLEGEKASFRMQTQAESDAVERLVEVVQADGWSGWSSPAADMLDLYEVTCRARLCAPLQLGVAEVEVIRKRILELTEQWQAVPVGKSLVLQFEGEGSSP